MKVNFGMVATLVVAALTNSTIGVRNRKALHPSRAPLSGNEGIEPNDWYFLEESNPVSDTSFSGSTSSSSEEADSSDWTPSVHQSAVIEVGPSDTQKGKGKAAMYSSGGSGMPRRASQRLVRLRNHQDANRMSEYNQGSTSASGLSPNGKNVNDEIDQTSLLSPSEEGPSATHEERFDFAEELQSLLQDPDQKNLEKSELGSSEKNSRQEVHPTVYENWNEMVDPTKYTPRQLAQKVRTIDIPHVSQVAISKAACKHIKDKVTPAYLEDFRKALFQESVKDGVAKFRNKIKPASERRTYVRKKPLAK